MVRRCRDVPGQHLFQYRDDRGRPRGVSSTDVNDYIRRAAGGDFTAKDFRTWAGTVLAAARLAGEDLPDSVKAAERIVVRVIREVADRLGNTPAVCRKSYINPVVFEAWRDQVVARMVPRGALAPSRLEKLALALLRERERKAKARGNGKA